MFWVLWRFFCKEIDEVMRLYWRYFLICVFNRVFFSLLQSAAAWGLMHHHGYSACACCAYLGQAKEIAGIRGWWGRIENHMHVSNSTTSRSADMLASIVRWMQLLGCSAYPAKDAFLAPLHQFSLPFLFGVSFIRCVILIVKNADFRLIFNT